MHYKPDPETYLGAVNKLKLKKHEAMLVAAHNNDLLAAKEWDLKTAFVLRATEYGQAKNFDLKAEENIDISALDFIELSTKLITLIKTIVGVKYENFVVATRNQDRPAEDFAPLWIQKQIML